MQRWSEWFKLLVSIMLPQIAGGIGSLYTRASLSTWYAHLEKPSFNPPSWVFGPVWITLYLLMGLSSFLVWHRGWNRWGVKPALTCFWAQLAVNSLWSWVFFGKRSTLGGLVVIGVLWGLILVTMRRFFRVSPRAGVLLIPYLLWVTFAGVLNYFIYVRNR